MNSLGSDAINTEPISSQANQSDKSPLWTYVDITDKNPGGGGTVTFKCSFCKDSFKGSYSRIKAHLLQISNKGIRVCKKVSQNTLSEMRKLEEDYENKKKLGVQKDVPLPCHGVASQSMLLDKKRKLSPLSKAFDQGTRDEMDQYIARMFYTAGLPFNLARNPYFVAAFNFAANHNLGGYVPPGYNKLRTTLLDQEKTHVLKLLEPLKSTWPQKGVSIMSDGWSDPQRRPLINFMTTTGNGPMFLKSINCDGETKNADFISSLMKEVIDSIGHQNVIQVITDNASNCKAAGEIIEGMYPNIYWTPCVVHTLNLALKNICSPQDTHVNAVTYSECRWIIDIEEDAKVIKNFIMQHSMRLSMFNKFCPLKLLSVAETRFASVVIMLKRFKLIRRSLEALVMSDEWSTYRESRQGVLGARFVKEKVLCDEWWDDLSYILEFTMPIYDMIRACDTDKPCLHLVYEMWDTMIEEVKSKIYSHEGKDHADESSFYEVVHTILIARWTKNNTPLHCLAHSLNPRFYSEDWLNKSSSRTSPDRDDEVSTERTKCFRRLYPNEEDFDKVIDEYAAFSFNQGTFGDSTSISRRANTDPITWWINFGSKTPMLQALALRVLGQPTSSSCCERNWSTFSFINSLKRNKLTTQRVEDLVFVHSNLRLLSRNNDEYHTGKSKMWDVGGDGRGNIIDENGFLENATLSLDEPELETVFFS